VADLAGEVTDTVSTLDGEEPPAAAFTDLGSRERTRLVAVYSLTTRLPKRYADARSLGELLVFGRFDRHLASSESILPRVFHTDAVDEPGLAVGDDALAAVRRLRGFVVVTPRADAAVVLDLEIDPTASGDAVATLLAQTCFQRDDLTVAGTPVLRWLAGRLLPDADEPLEFGLDVHQIVYPGAALHDEILRDDVDRALSNLVYRGTVAGTGLLHKPAALNYGNSAFAAHGRGVSVLGGWGEPVENIIAVVATTIVSTLGVLQRTKQTAFRALALNDRAMLSSPSDARRLIGRLADRLMTMQLDLSFGVEAFLDSVLVPELVVESFQTSLRDALRTADSLDYTSRMVDRLQTVINVRRTELEAAVQSRVEQRGKILSGVGLIGSILALPPALLLAFFGVNATNVDNTRSILDLGRYWGAYAAAFSPFVVLALIGWLMLRGTRKPRPATTGDDGLADDLD
jgi:hypothetical protein